MKKTLVALAVSAFAVSSASAVTLYDNEGTKVDFAGSLRIFAQKASHKEDGEKAQRNTKKNHSTLRNAGSRFNFAVKHNVNDDLYALGYYETRLASGASNDAGWGDIRTQRAYVGLGTNSGHLVTFGKQLVIGDDIGQAGYDKTLDVGSSNIRNGYSVLTTESDSAVQYKYTGIEGLTLAAHYDFANEGDRDAANAEKAGYGVGAIYKLGLAEAQSLTLAAGYTHKDLVNVEGKKGSKDGVFVGAKYKVGAFDAAIDLGRGERVRDLAIADVKDKLNYLRVGARYQVDPAVGVYGNYSYTTVKTAKADYKNTGHQYMLGADYKLHKQVITYVEGYLNKEKDNANSKVTDKIIGVGMRVFW